MKRALLGVTIADINEEIATDLKLSSRKGVYINGVSEGGTADKAGMKKDDIIISLGGHSVNKASELQERVNSFHPGDETTCVIIRNGEEKTLNLTFQGTMDENGTVSEDGSVAFYGSKLRKAPKEVLQQLGLKNGVEIVSVGEGKLLSAGAAEGFVILYVNDQPVSKPEDVIEIANKAKRAIYIEGVTARGKASYFGFGKE